MSTISNIEIKTKSGVVVVAKNGITYGESQEISDVYRNDKLSNVEQVHKADKLGVEKVIISIDGASEKVYESFCALPLKDAREIAEHIKSVLDPKAEPTS